MAKVTPPPGSLEKPPRVRGVFYVRGDPRTGWTAQGWPKKYERTKGFAYQKYKELEFALASQLASQVNYLDMETLQYLAQGTRYTWRDLQIRAIYGRLYNFYSQTGEVWIASRDVDPNPQYILDLITDVPGSVLFRNELGWFGLDPGNDGYALFYDATLKQPVWKTPTSGGGGGGGSPGQLGFATPTAPVLANFTWDQGSQGDAVTTDHTDFLTLVAGSVNATNLRLLGEAAPTGTPWEKIAGLHLGAVPAVNYVNAGIYMLYSGDTRVVTNGLSINTNDAFVQATYWNSASSYNATKYAGNFRGFAYNMLWLKLADDGTNITASFSSDGVVFIPIWTAPRGDFLTGAADRVGIFVDMENASALQIGASLFDWR